MNLAPKLHRLFLLFVVALLASGCQATRDLLASDAGGDTVRSLISSGIDLAMAKSEFVGKADVVETVKTVAGDLIDEQAAKGVSTGEVSGIAAAVTTLGVVATNYLRNQKYRPKVES